MKLTPPTSIKPSALVLAVFALAVLAGLSTVSEAAPTRVFACAAKIDCGSPSLPSVQDLPSEATPTVSASSESQASRRCLKRHFSSYARLAQSLDSRRSGVPLVTSASARGDGRRAPATRSPELRKVMAASSFLPVQGCKVLSAAIPSRNP